MESSPEHRFARIAEVLGVGCVSAERLQHALRHASSCDPRLSASERAQESNERLEFLGDAVLGGVVGWLLYERFPGATEGALTRLRARLVSRRSLAQAMRHSGLSDCAEVGSNLPRPWPESVLANLAEGLLGAVFVDGGWPAAVTAVKALLKDALAACDLDDNVVDSKNRVQEWSLAKTGSLPVYTTQRSGGSDHAPLFTCVVTVGDQQGMGEGPSRRKAEVAAAEDLLARLLQQP